MNKRNLLKERKRLIQLHGHKYKRHFISEGNVMENFKIVGYLVTYYLSLENGLEHLDRFDTLDDAEDFVDRLEPEEYWINPIVDLSGE